LTLDTQKASAAFLAALPNSDRGEAARALHERRAPLSPIAEAACTYLPRAWASVIFRRISSTSEKPAVRLKVTSRSVANSGRPVAIEPDDATIAAAIVAARANLLVAKRIDDPVPWDQFVTNYFQHR
jgi:hypothetical protein